MSAADDVTVTISTPPVANAGPNQTVNYGATVTLDGSGSSRRGRGYAHLRMVADGGDDRHA